MLPRVILHNAVSVDGRINFFNVDMELYYSIINRWKEDATLVGSETILQAPDEIPEENTSDLNPRPPEANDKRPILVVPDSKGRIQCWHYLRNLPYWKHCIALCSESTPPTSLEYLKKRHVDFIITGKDHANLREALEILHSEYNVNIVRVDSGGTLNGAMLRNGLVDEISLLVHPCLVGGLTYSSIFQETILPGINETIPLTMIHHEVMKNDILWLIFKLNKKE